MLLVFHAHPALGPRDTPCCLSSPLRALQDSRPTALRRDAFDVSLPPVRAHKQQPVTGKFRKSRASNAGLAIPLILGCFQGAPPFAIGSNYCTFSFAGVANHPFGGQRRPRRLFGTPSFWVDTLGGVLACADVPNETERSAPA